MSAICPVYAKQQTFPGPVGSSHLCQGAGIGTWSFGSPSWTGSVSVVSCVCCLSHPGILVMKSTEEWDGHDRSSGLDWTAERGVLGECEMRPGAIVVVGVGCEDLPKVHFAQDHDMVQAFSPDRADEPFNLSVLPGRARRSWSVPDAHGSKTPRYGMAIRGVSVADEVSGCLIPGEGLGDLAGDPVGRRVESGVDPYQVASVIGQNTNVPNVRGFVRGWRTRRDSNSRPLPSEGSARSTG
jgi:hypothetical protein